MTDTPSNTNTALLVQVLEQLGELREDSGKIKAQLEHGSRRFDATDGRVKALGKRLATIETFIGKKMAPLLAGGSAIIAVVLWLIAISAGGLVTWLKGLVTTHLHWS